MNIIRRTGAASAATLGAFVAAILFAHALSPRWAQRMGLDVWALPAAVAQERGCRTEAAALDAKGRQLRNEIELADYVALQLVEGSISISEAVDRMEPLLLKREGFVTTAPISFHTATIRQAVARCLLARIPALLTGDEQLRQAVMARLEAEYICFSNP